MLMLEAVAQDLGPSSIPVTLLLQTVLRQCVTPNRLPVVGLYLGGRAVVGIAVGAGRVFGIGLICLVEGWAQGCIALVATQIPSRVFGRGCADSSYVVLGIKSSKPAAEVAFPFTWRAVPFRSG